MFKSAFERKLLPAPNTDSQSNSGLSRRWYPALDAFVALAVEWRAYAGMPRHLFGNTTHQDLGPVGHEWLRIA